MDTGKNTREEVALRILCGTLASGGDSNPAENRIPFAKESLVKKCFELADVFIKVRDNA